MFDPEIELTGPHPEKTADKPAAGITRVEHQRAIDQSNHSTDILAGPRQHLGSIREHDRVVLHQLQRSASKINRLAAGGLRIQPSLR